MRQLRNSLLNARIRAFLSDLSGVAAVEFAYYRSVADADDVRDFRVVARVDGSQAFPKIGRDGRRPRRPRGTALACQRRRRDQSAKHLRSGSKFESGIVGNNDFRRAHMEPYDTAPLQLRVYQVWASTTDATQSKIEWSYRTERGHRRMRQTPITMANGLLQPSARALIVDAQYQYAPLLKNILPELPCQHELDRQDDPDAPLDTDNRFLQALNNERDWKTQGPDTTPCRLISPATK